MSPGLNPDFGQGELNEPLLVGSSYCHEKLTRKVGPQIWSDGLFGKLRGRRGGANTGGEEGRRLSRVLKLLEGRKECFLK